MMRIEDNVPSPKFKSLSQRRILDFQNGHENVEKRKWCYGTHSPVKGCENERFHTVDRLNFEEETFVPLCIKTLDILFQVIPQQLSK